MSVQRRLFLQKSGISNKQRKPVSEQQTESKAEFKPPFELIERWFHHVERASEAANNGDVMVHGHLKVAAEIRKMVLVSVEKLF
jgi:hypothetical protein